MSRINTNISSLQAMNRLNKNNADLATRLQRLSTGLKINTGKDAPGAPDPTGDRPSEGSTGAAGSKQTGIAPEGS